MIILYGFHPAFGVPDVSPFVTKAFVYLTLSKVPFEYRRQNSATRERDAPFGKLPYIVDTSNNDAKIPDSSTIIEYIEKTYDEPLDKGLSLADRAISTAFERLLCDHLNWSGMVVPRWRLDHGFDIYLPHLLNGIEVTPEIKAHMQEGRKIFNSHLDGQGMGRRDMPTILHFYRRDIDAVSEFLGDKKFFLGETVRSIDAIVYGMLRHITDQPIEWEGSGYVESKPNLVAYFARMKELAGW